MWVLSMEEAHLWKNLIGQSLFLVLPAETWLLCTDKTERIQKQGLRITDRKSLKYEDICHNSLKMEKWLLK